MNRSDAITFCHKYAHKYFYQPVVFVPGIIEVAGKWNNETKELSRLCLEKAEDKIVLDLGCNIGFFVREALKLGSRLAIGLDHDPIEMDIAREITAITQDKAILIQEKAEDYAPEQDIDIALMLNILHVVQDPKALISRYLECSKTVVIEHIDSQRAYFSQQPIASIDSPRCHGYRTVSFFGSDELVPNCLR